MCYFVLTSIILECLRSLWLLIDRFLFRCINFWAGPNFTVPEVTQLPLNKYKTMLTPVPLAHIPFAHPYKPMLGWSMRYSDIAFLSA